MKSLLYLAHRLPYPPNKGDKITSFNMLKFLSRHFDVHLACFVDQPEDWQYLDKVREYCASSCILPLRTRQAKILSLRGLLTGEALSLPYYRNRHLQRWVSRTLNNRQIDAVLIFSGVMAQYVSGRLSPGTRSVLDLEDVDSDKWRQYAEDHRWPMNWLYARESRRLLSFEKAMAAEFDSTVLVSADEAAFFKTLAPEVAPRVVHRVQGVDSNFFDPQGTYENPFQPGERPFVFIGAMDYWPNVDAAQWFARAVFPAVREAAPEARFYVVGMNPGDEVRRLAQLPGVVVTGSVPDVRPYLAHCVAAVLPLRVARGIQNKVLEAMAMQKPVIATDNAMQGIIACEGFHPTVANDEHSLQEAALAQLRQAPQDQSAARQCILRHYNWDTNLKTIEQLLSQP